MHASVEEEMQTEVFCNLWQWDLFLGVNNNNNNSLCLKFYHFYYLLMCLHFHNISKQWIKTLYRQIICTANLMQNKYTSSAGI